MPNKHLVLLLGLSLGAASTLPGAANAATFTWAPSDATPALTTGSASFTADAMSLTNYIRTTNVNNLATLQQSFSGAQIEVINGFTLAGAPVNAPG